LREKRPLGVRARRLFVIITGVLVSEARRGIQSHRRLGSGEPEIFHRLLLAHGCTPVRQGKGDHEIWQSPITAKRSLNVLQPSIAVI
jgi:hypothetical protein